MDARSGNVRVRFTRFKGTIAVNVVEITIAVHLMRDGTVHVVFNGRQGVPARVLFPEFAVRV